MLTTTNDGIVTSFGMTPQASDDLFLADVTGLTEDSTCVVYLDVMANDLGGKAKSLFSLDNGIEYEGSSTSADLLTRDLVGVTQYSAWGAKIAITPDGKVSYTLTESARAHYQSLGAGHTGTDTFTYAIKLGNGTLSWATVQVQIAGVNDAPVAVADVKSVKEDTLPNPVSGNVLVNDTDVDTLDTHSVTAVNGAAANVGVVVTGTYGTLHLNADGSYTYTLDNSKPAVQALAEGQAVTDSFTYTNSDNHGASSSSTLTITVNGANDAPVAVADSGSAG